MDEMSKHRYKRLNVPSYMLHDTLDFVACGEEEFVKELGKEETEPVFGKDGWYFDRIEGKSWAETTWNGKVRAFKDRRIDDFLYKLSVASHRPLNDREKEAINILLLYRSGHDLKGTYRKMRELLWRDQGWKQLRDTKRSYMKF